MNNRTIVLIILIVVFLGWILFLQIDTTRQNDEQTEIISVSTQEECINLFERIKKEYDFDVGLNEVLYNEGLEQCLVLNVTESTPENPIHMANMLDVVNKEFLYSYTETKFPNNLSSNVRECTESHMQLTVFSSISGDGETHLINGKCEDDKLEREFADTTKLFGFKVFPG